MNETRELVHEMVDRLPAVQLRALAGLLRAMLDEEAPTEDEERAVEQARQWLRENGGIGIAHREVLGDFGLTEDDFRRMAEKRGQTRG